MGYLTDDEMRSALYDLRQGPGAAVDTEGTLTHPFSKTWGLSTSTGGKGDYFAFNHELPGSPNLDPKWLPQIIDILKQKEYLIFHNAKHDLKALRNLGFDYQGKFYCTMMMTHMVDENLPSKALDYVSKHYGGEPKRNEQVMKDIIKGFGWGYIPVELMRPYGANDALITEELFQNLWPDFEGQNFHGELWDTEQAFTRTLGKIEDNGILVDQSLCERELDRGLKIMASLQKGLGFNPGSTKQLGLFLLDELSLPVVKRSKTTGNPSFDKEAMKVYEELLKRTNDKRATEVLIYRGWAKTTSSNYKSYLEKLGPDGRLRPNFKQHGTRTGRLSCEDPNLQQIPRESSNDWNGHLKRAFIVDPGRVAYEFDYSQLEFRLGAAYGKVQRLLDIFNDPERDVFNEMSKDLGFTRQDCKTLTYTMQFGGGETRVSEVFGVSRPAARAIRNKFFGEYRGLKDVSDLAQRRCIQNGFVQYWTGRRRHFNNPHAEGHKAFNAVCQGGAFEIVKRAMVRLDKEGINNGVECKIDLQVHDSVRADIEEGKENVYIPEIKRVMEDVQQEFGVAFRVDAKEWST